MITRVRARNFRSLRNLDLCLGPLNVLVGPNMGGKSNVLDLFRFLYDLWLPQQGASGVVSALAKRQGIDEVLWKGGSDRLLSVGIEFAGPGQRDRSYIYDIELVGGPGGYVTIQKETLVLRTAGEDHQLIVNDDQGRWLHNAESGRLITVQSDRSAMEFSPPNWDGFPLRVFAQNWRSYQLVPSLMKQLNLMTAGESLDRVGSNLSAWLMWLQTRSPENFARIAEAARDVFPAIRQLKTLPSNQGTVSLSSHEQVLLHPTSIFQMSDGELVFIAFLSLIFAPDDLSGTLFLIEEPDNHLHPRLFETLVSLLRQAHQEVRDRGASPSQIIATTHSPFVIDQLDLEEILWVEKRAAETRVVHPAARPGLRKLVEDKEVGLGELMFAGALSEE